MQLTNKTQTVREAGVWVPHSRFERGRVQQQTLREAQRSKQIVSAEEPVGNEVRTFGRMCLTSEDSKRFASMAKACVRDAARARANDEGGGDTGMHGDESDGEGLGGGSQ